MSLLRNFMTVGSGTLSSRVLGFGRDMLMAAALGTGPIADAFVVAFRLPNLFRRVFGEGAFNSAFIPLFAKELEGDGMEQAKAFAEEALSSLLMALLVVTLIAEAAMPWLVLAIAPGFSDDPEKFALTVLLTRITFPYLALVSLVAVFSGVLNSFRRFALAAFAPTLLNVCMIAALLLVHAAGFAGTPRAGILLAWGVTLGGVVQLLPLIISLRRAGFALAWRRPRLTPRVRRLVSLGVPGVLAGGATQVNIVIGTMIASLQAGAVSYLYYADRLYQLPLGVVGVAIGVVLLPELARRLKAGDDGAAQHQQNRAIEFSMLLTLPAALALALIPGPIVQVLFERGAFDAEATRATALALGAFAVGLPGFVLIKVFSPGFFAREDTRTPMLYAGIGVAANVAVSLALFPALGHLGIAIATTVSGWVNAGLLGFTLWRRGHLVFDRRLGRRLSRILLATLVMGAVLFVSVHLLLPWLDRSQSGLVQLAALLVLCTAGAVAFFATAILAGAASLSELTGAVARRRPA